jgi:hypothetical protein
MIKRTALLITLLFFTITNQAANRPQDKFGGYLSTLGAVSGLFSKLLDNVAIIAARPDRISFKNLAVDFNRKVNAMIINENHFITLINNKNTTDAAFNNSYRILEENAGSIKKLLVTNRPLVDQLNIKDFNTANVYGRLDMRLYENDELVKQMPKKHRQKTAFKSKITDNSTQTIIILNEIHSKVSALYSKLK